MCESSRDRTSGAPAANNLGMDWYDKSSSKYEYLGDCKSTVDCDRIWDATEMAQAVEKGVASAAGVILPQITDSQLGKDMVRFPDRFSVFTHGELLWVHDLEQDIHHFFRRVS